MADKRNIVTFDRLMGLLGRDKEGLVVATYSTVGQAKANAMSESELRKHIISLVRLDATGTQKLITLDDASLKNVLHLCGYEESELSGKSRDDLEMMAISLIGDRSVKAEQLKEWEARQVVQNIDDAMIKVTQEYLANYEADPVGATEKYLYKMGQLKKQYVESAEICGTTETPKHEFIMNTFETVEEHKLYKPTVRKTAAENAEAKKQYYTEMSGDVKETATRVGGVLSTFDKAEDIEEKEKESATVERPKTRDSEYRKNIVDNVVEMMEEIFYEFIESFNANPENAAAATHTFLTKMDQLRRDYMVSASLVSGAKATDKHKFVMGMFEQFGEFKIYSGESDGMKEYYEGDDNMNMAWQVLHKAQASMGRVVKHVGMEYDEKSKPSSEVEERKEFVENIGEAIDEIFKEFMDNYADDPAKATEIFIQKMTQLKRKYTVEASLVQDAKKSEKFKRATNIFKKFEDYGVYDEKSAKVDKQTYYETIAPHVYGEARAARIKVERLCDFDVKD